MIRRILVPVDFSPASLAAVTVAGDLARQLAARVRLLTILDVSDLRAALKAHVHGFRTDAELRRALRRWLRDRWAEIGMPASVRWTHAIRRGIVETEIVRDIHAYRPQLVVIGSTGVTRKLPIGSKAAYLLRHSPVPVLVCPLRRA